MQVGTIDHQDLHGVNQQTVALGCAHDRHAPHHHVRICQPELLPHGRVLDSVGHHYRGVNGFDKVSRHASIDQVLPHVMTHRGDAMGNPGVRQQGSNAVGQVTRADNQRGLGQPGAKSCDKRIAPTVRVENIYSGLLENATNCPCAFQEIE